MPIPRKHPSNARRQLAYRERQALKRAAEQQERRLPSLPAIPSIPGIARWNAELALAAGLLSSVISAMSDYYDARSQRWQESGRGEAFLERLEELAQVSDQLEPLL